MSFTPGLGGPQLQGRADETGQFGVSEQTGSPSYRYLFTVPPGRLNVQPDLALVYSPGARQVAEGWSLDVPRIDRITGEGVANDLPSAFIAHVGKHRDRLIRAGADVHTEERTLAFRAAVDYDFIRYEFFIDGARWEARTQDGTVYVFGVYLGDGWGLSQMRDRFGNRMDIYYEPFPIPIDEARPLYPVDFWYTANANAGLPAHAHLHLDWERACVNCIGAPQGVRVSYRNGARILEGGAILRSAHTEVFDINATHIPPREVRRWNFHYSADPGISCGGGDTADAAAKPTRHRYLCAIDETARARDGSVQSAPQIRFTYGRAWRSTLLRRGWGRLPAGVFPTSGYTSDFPGPRPEGDTINNGLLKSIPIDFDGDGLMDILVGPPMTESGFCNRRQSTYTWYRNTGSGFDNGHTFSLPNDFPGADGRPVLENRPPGVEGVLRCSLGAVRWYELKNNRYELKTEISRQFVDLRGRGLPDVVDGVGGVEGGEGVGCKPGSNGSRWRVHFNRGVVGSSMFDTPVDDICAPLPAKEQGEEGFFDLNGDHLPDLVDTFPPWGVYLNTGDFETRSQSGEINPWSARTTWNNSEDIELNQQFRLGRNNVVSDVNGDGLPDFVYTPPDHHGARVRANTGVGFEPASRAYQWDPFDTDGVVEKERCPGCARNPPEGPKVYERYLADFDGDGLLDYLRPDLAGQDWILPGGFQRVTAQQPYPDALTLDQLRGLAVGAAYHTEREFLDWTGDGRPDILAVAPDGQVRLFTDNPAPEEADDAPALLKTVNNGRGMVVAYHYAPSSDATILTRNVVRTSQDWIQPRLPFPVWVVKRIDVAVDCPPRLECSPTATTTYLYEDPVTAPDVGQKVGASFRGFQTVRTILPKTATDARAPEQVSSYTYRPDLDPSGLLVSTSHSEAVVTPIRIVMQQRTVDRTTYSSAPLFGGATRFIFASEQVHIECVPSLTPCEPQVGHRTISHDEFSPDSAASLFYLPRRHQEEADGSASRATEFEWISKNEEGTYLVLPKRRTLSEQVQGEPPRWVPRTKEEFLYDGSSNPDQFGGLFGSVKGLQTLNIIYRDPVGNAQPVCSGTAYYPQTGQVINTVRPKQMQPCSSDPNQITGTRTSYDDRRLYPETVTNELGHEVHTAYDVGTGKMLVRQGPNRKRDTWEETDFEYDGFGRVKKETVSVDNADSYAKVVRTTYRYLDGAPHSRVSGSRRIEWNEDRYVLTLRRYDGAGRLVIETVGPFDPEVPRPQETHLYVYNERGALAKIKGPDPRANDMSLVAYQFQRDSRNRVNRLENPDGTAVNVFYGPWTKEIVEEDGSDKREISDGFGRLVRVDEYNRAGPTATTLYGYDGADRLIKIINAGDTDAAAQNPDDPTRLTQFEPDGQSNRLAITRPGDKHWRYVYDLDGNLFTRTDPDGRVTEFHYDVLDRITEKQPTQSLLSPGEAENLGVGPVRYHYDGMGANLVGRLAQVQFLAGSQTIPYAQVAYGYDAQGLATSEAWQWNVGPTGAQQAAMARTYNALGALSTVNYPNGMAATYGYDDDRGLVKAVSAGGQTLAKYRYNFARRVKERNSDLPQLHTYGYDVRGHLKTDAFNIDGRRVMQQDYEYSGNGDVRSITVLDELEPSLGSSWTYQLSYDDLHRLRHADTGSTLWSNANYQADFTYAPSGNVASATVLGPVSIHPRDVTYKYCTGTDADCTGTNADPQAVRFMQNRNGGRFLNNEYDSSGNLRQRSLVNTAEVTRFTNDVDGMPRRVRKGNRSERYFYDHNNRRFLAIANDGSWRFQLGDDYEAEVSSGRRQENAYVLGAGEAVARLGSVTGPSGTRRTTKALLHHSHRGDLLAAIGDSGGVDAHFVYGAFGELLYASDAVSDWRRRFNGKEQDQIDGLSYYGYRFYDSLTLQWISGDPIFRFAPDVALGAPGGLNLYSFSLNNSLRYLDPNGLFSFEKHLEGPPGSQFGRNVWCGEDTFSCSEYAGETRTIAKRRAFKAQGLSGAALDEAVRCASTGRCRVKVVDAPPPRFAAYRNRPGDWITWARILLCILSPDLCPGPRGPVHPAPPPRPQDPTISGPGPEPHPDPGPPSPSDEPFSPRPEAAEGPSSPKVPATPSPNKPEGSSNKLWWVLGAGAVIGIGILGASTGGLGWFLAPALGVSDRRRKKNFGSVDSQQILEELANLEVSSWSYKIENDNIRHVGPMAQDFYRVFGLGKSDKVINSVDANGVLIAAVQALYKQLAERDTQLAVLASKLAEVNAKLVVLGQFVASRGKGNDRDPKKGSTGIA